MEKQRRRNFSLTQFEQGNLSDEDFKNELFYAWKTATATRPTDKLPENYEAMVFAEFVVEYLQLNPNKTFKKAQARFEQLQK